MNFMQRWPLRPNPDIIYQNNQNSKLTQAKMYSTKQSYSYDDITSSNMEGHGWVRRIFNYCQDWFNRPNILNTLSVTINPDNNVITPEFFKNTHRRCDKPERRWSDENLNYQDFLPQENHMQCDNRKSSIVEEFFNRRNAVGEVTDMEPMKIINDNTTANFADPIEVPKKPDLSSIKVRARERSRKPSLNTSRRKRNRSDSKSQLRRSGISQKQHRKQIGKRPFLDDIRDDLEWLTLNEGKKSCGEDEVDATSDSIKSEKNRENNKIKKKQRKKRKKTEAAQKRKEESLNFVVTFNAVRSISESSIDSEDSFCIMFEEENSDNSDADSICFLQADLDSDSDEDDVFCQIDFYDGPNFDREFDYEKLSQANRHTMPAHVATKIRFSTNNMSYEVPAFCESRKGPWEEMARDRERLGRKIESVLTPEHRNNIWQQRFKDFYK